MAYLVNPINRPVDDPMPVTEALQQVRAAHDYLVAHGVETLRLIQNEENALWGTQMKRVKITFPQGERPELIPEEHIEHSLIEVMNQCATMERLIDALVWANENLPDYSLLLCHPTTSSIPKDSAVADNDIVLINSEGKLAKFEISDVSSTGDGNQKEFKDLKSLGVRLAGSSPLSVCEPFANRLFMVVSSEMGERIRRRMVSYYPKSQPYFCYNEHTVTNETCIFEVLPR